MPGDILAGLLRQTSQGMGEAQNGASNIFGCLNGGKSVVSGGQGQSEDHRIVPFAPNCRRNEIGKRAFIAAEALAFRAMPHQWAAPSADHEANQIAQPLQFRPCTHRSERQREVMGDLHLPAVAVAPLPQEQNGTFFKNRKFRNHTHRRAADGRPANAGKAAPSNHSIIIAV